MVGRPTFHALLRALPFAALTLATATASLVAPATPRNVEAESVVATDWRHPVDVYPKSVRRWFAELPAELQYSAVRRRHGDDPRWANPNWDDSAWETTGFWDLPARAGIDWVRFRVRVGTDASGTPPAGIMISTVRAYQLFWDGVLLGHSGVPGNSAAQEVPGYIDKTFSIPAGLLGPGEHTVALRTSSHRCGFPAPSSGLRFLLDAPAVLQGKVLREAFVPTIAAGALFMTALASLIMWLLAARRATLVLLSLVCLSGAVMQALQAVRWFFPYPADWHYPVLSSMTALVGVQGLLMIALVMKQFQVPRRRFWLALLVPALVLVSWFSPARMNLEGVRLFAVAIGVALASALWAAWRRKLGAWAVVGGVATSGLLIGFEAEDYRASFFMKFLPALVGVITTLALQIRSEQRQARAAQLAVARLETELLKKNLQPHFLLNTLAVLTEIVEQDPHSAAKLIEDLADEFRSVARLSAETLIPLEQELELCRAHLRVMSIRTGRTWALDVTGADQAELVPPAVFLTLIENGFAHQRTAAAASATFRLAVESAPDGTRRHVFWSPGELQEIPSRPEGGTGLRYVKARFEESFPGRWSLVDGPADGGWRTVIEIRHRPTRSALETTFR